MNAYLGCVSGDARGSAPYVNRNRSGTHITPLAATLDRLFSTSTNFTHIANSGSRMHDRTNSLDAVHTVVLTRSNLDKPWGFRIQGGQDYNLQLTVKKVRLDSCL